MVKKCCTKLCCKTCLRYNLLSILTFTAVVVGVILGIILKVSFHKNFWTERRAKYVGFLGDIYLAMMECMVVPLISTTIIQALGSVKVQYSRLIAFKGALYYICMTLIAVCVGIILVVTIAPGKKAEKVVYEFDFSEEDLNNDCALVEDNVLDLFRSLFPSNILRASMQLDRTQIILRKCDKNKTCMDFEKCSDYEKELKLDPKGTPALSELKTEVGYLNGPNFLGVIVFSTVLAIAIVKLGEKGRTLLAFFTGLAEAMLLMTTWVTWVSPIGITSLIAGEILREQKLQERAVSMGYYILTVMAGFMIHGFMVLPGFYMIFTKKLPFKFVGQMSKVLLTAFGTSSSSGTVPVTIECLEERVKIDSQVVRFLIPMGATLNLAGTALYEAVGSIFIAQAVGKELKFYGVVLVSLTATLASIGAAGVPAAGALTMVMVLRTINLDPKLLALVIAFDWILDRFQTVVNVLGDSFGVAIVYHWTRKEFAKLSLQNHVDPEQVNEGQEETDVVAKEPSISKVDSQTSLQNKIPDGGDVKKELNKDNKI